MLTFNVSGILNSDIYSNIWIELNKYIEKDVTIFECIEFEKIDLRENNFKNIFPKIIKEEILD